MQTNELLEKVIDEVDQLIAWAEADLQHAEENNYKADKSEAKARIKDLTKAKHYLFGAFKDL